MLSMPLKGIYPFLPRGGVLDEIIMCQFMEIIRIARSYAQKLGMNLRDSGGNDLVVVFLSERRRR